MVNSQCIEPRQNMSVITFCLPRHNTASVVKKLFADGIYGVYLNGARGTLIQDRWYQGLLPMLNPELEVVQTIMPTSHADSAMRQIVHHAQLYRSGAGMVYSTPCLEFYRMGEYPLCRESEVTAVTNPAPMHFRENLTAIHLINQGDRTDSVCRAAINAGAHGPMVEYTRGVGLRDRLGWLRITSKPTKEVVSVIVDTVESDHIFNVMAEAAQVARPGRGVLYSMPVQKGMINMDSVYARTRHSATMQQVIRAIDELKQSKAWRDQSVMDMESGRNNSGHHHTSNHSDDQLVRLSIITNHLHSSTFSLYLMQNGAPGVNISHLQMQKIDDKDNQHSNLVHIRTVISHQTAMELKEKLFNQLTHDALVYTQAIGVKRSYQAPQKSKTGIRPARIYRGGVVS